MRIILHIGMAKTGTSAIQRYLVRNAGPLEDAGILYPLLSLTPESHLGLRPAVTEPADFPVRLRRKTGGDDQALERASEREWDHVGARVRASGAHTLLLSSEGFFKPARVMEPAFSRRIGELGEVERVIVYMRHPAAAWLSHVNQLLATHNLRPALTHRVDPADVLADYAAAFPSARMVVRAYAREDLVDGDAVADFLDAAGIEPVAPLGDHTAVNASVSAEAMVLMQEMGLPAPPASWLSWKRQRMLRRAVGRIDRGLPGRSQPRLAKDVSRYLASIATPYLRLRETYGLILSGLDYDLIGTKIARPETGGDIARICEIDQPRLARMRDEFASVARFLKAWDGVLRWRGAEAA